MNNTGNDSEKGKTEMSNRSQTYDLLLTSKNVLLLSHMTPVRA